MNPKATKAKQSERNGAGKHIERDMPANKPPRLLSPKDLEPKERLKGSRSDEDGHNYDMQCPKCGNNGQKFIAGPFSNTPNPKQQVQCPDCFRVADFREFQKGFVNVIVFVPESFQKCRRCKTNFHGAFMIGRNKMWRGCPGPTPKDGEEAIGCGVAPLGMPVDRNAIFASSPKIEEWNTPEGGMARPEAG